MYLLQIEPLSSLLEGGTMVTISGSNLGQKTEDILDSVSVAGVACNVIPNLYEVSSRYRPAVFCVYIFKKGFNRIQYGSNRNLNTYSKPWSPCVTLCIIKGKEWVSPDDQVNEKCNLCLPGSCAGPKPVGERRWAMCLWKWAEESLANPARHSATRYIRFGLITLYRIRLCWPELKHIEQKWKQNRTKKTSNWLWEL